MKAWKFVKRKSNTRSVDENIQVEQAGNASLKQFHVWESHIGDAMKMHLACWELCSKYIGPTCKILCTQHKHREARFYVPENVQELRQHEIPKVNVEV